LFFTAIKRHQQQQSARIVELVQPLKLTTEAETAGWQIHRRLTMMDESLAVTAFNCHSSRPT